MYKVELQPFNSKYCSAMLRSMTAYGRSSLTTPLGRFSVEIQSVNRKHLEVNTALPTPLLCFDADIKKWVAAHVGRGQVNIRVNIAYDQGAPVTVSPNLTLALQIQKAWHQLSDNLKIPFNEQQFMSMLSQTEGILNYEEELQDESLYKNALQTSIHQAIEQLVRMKKREGQALYEDITKRMAILAQLIAQIASRSSNATVRYREKLQERLTEALGASIENEERILREVCVYADKVDIAEEITRFDSHLQQMLRILQTEGEGVGKTLEFLIQELNREVNTVGSKSSDAEISRFVVEIKTELERIREQIQNIE
jgi:uncharacterized protein (TIGR00255 family)